ncbi:HicA-like toxin of HicAB toxin-antitoxin system [Aminicella lysinilytica]|uniref:HicA-like toxin of HicAB toxin-antitoxin system n=1 Tax=Aminicella lysinilytica TaxID=433323 RepID=A0A4V3CQT9_9FIRM|nr:HicA-like toxin of HicAB toxin-antitoxin system [Aminicella lysinilytica]
MSSREKQISRFLSKPSDYKYDELITVLGFLGYSERKSGGRTSGSRVHFVNSNKRVISLHKPHPGNGNYVKKYAIELVISALKESGDL